MVFITIIQKRNTHTNHKSQNMHMHSVKNFKLHWVDDQTDTEQVWQKFTRQRQNDRQGETAIYGYVMLYR